MQLFWLILISNPQPKRLKRVNDLSKENKSPYVCLLDMIPRDAYIITIHVCTIDHIVH